MLNPFETVQDSEDLRRVLAAPARTPPSLEEQEELAEVMTAYLRRDNPSCQCAKLSPEPCLTRLRPIQGWALYEAMRGGGMLGFLSPGCGKTALDILTAMVFPDVNYAVVMVPPQLKAQLLLDYARWSQHFKVPNLVGGDSFVVGRPRLEVLTYSMLSSQGFALWFKSHSPDLIIADEADALKLVKSARTGRFLRYYLGGGTAALVAHSGTLCAKGVIDYAHLSTLALRGNSPVPFDQKEAALWSSALHPTGKGIPVLPGALKQLAKPGETVKAGFQRRLTTTPGVVMSADAQLDIPLVIKPRPLTVPQRIKDLLEDLREQQVRPDLEILTEPAERAACARQIAMGFYYFWKYPRGEPQELIEEWFAKRQAWNACVRAELESPRPGLDTPGLLENAAVAGAWACPAWPMWRDVRSKVEPETDARWLDDFIVQDAAAWALDSPGIVWYTHRTLGLAIEKATGLPRYGEGEDASRLIAREDGSRSIIASVRAHGTGKNLQRFSRNLITCSPAGGRDFEQLLARTHRSGQQAEQVTAEVYLHTEELLSAFDNAIAEAKNVFETHGTPQRLLYASVTRPRAWSAV